MFGEEMGVAGSWEGRIQRDDARSSVIAVVVVAVLEEHRGGVAGENGLRAQLSDPPDHGLAHDRAVLQLAVVDRQDLDARETKEGSCVLRLLPSCPGELAAVAARVARSSVAVRQHDEMHRAT